MGAAAARFEAKIDQRTECMEGIMLTAAMTAGRMHKLVDDRTLSTESMLISAQEVAAKQMELLKQNAAAESPRLTMLDEGDGYEMSAGAAEMDDGTTQLLQFQAQKIVSLTQEKMALEEQVRKLQSAAGAGVGAAATTTTRALLPHPRPEEGEPPVASVDQGAPLPTAQRAEVESLLGNLNAQVKMLRD
jgi:hypothetical protein